MNSREPAAAPRDTGAAAATDQAGRAGRLPWRRRLLTCIVLVGAVAAVYGRTIGFEFVSFDDDVHAYENPRINSGLSYENLVWDFEIHGPSQWHPLAYLSHQLDFSLFGKNAGLHHLSSVVLHALATILLFFALHRLTGGRRAAALAAAAFAVHPLNVESVAWISERRNVLCAVFWMATLWSYAVYAGRPKLTTYLPVACFHACALMSKPLAVTLPAVLLLLDYWPLHRLHIGATGKRLLLEKVPLFALSIGAGVLTILCQRAVGTVVALDVMPLSQRAANSLAAYGWYLFKTVWPTELCFFYPHPSLVGADPWGQLAVPAVVSGVLVVAITAAAVACRRTRAWLLVGWLWFLGVLVPMIGLIQVGEQRYADRYAYLPLVGIFMAIAFALPRRALPAAVMILCAWGVMAYRQAGVWRDSTTLYTHAIQIDDRNHYAHHNLGKLYLDSGRTYEAVEQFRKAVDAVPNYALAQYSLGITLHKMGLRDEAMGHLRRSLELNPLNIDAYQHLAAALADLGRLQEAVEQLQAALKLAPDNRQLRFNLVLALTQSDRFREARELVAPPGGVHPDDIPAALALGSRLYVRRRYTEARDVFELILQTSPDLPEGHLALGHTLRELGDRDGAIKSFESALRLRPGWPEARAELERLRGKTQ
jgi:protein O-mannosyl-transferase